MKKSEIPVQGGHRVWQQIPMEKSAHRVFSSCRHTLRALREGGCSSAECAINHPTKTHAWGTLCVVIALALESPRVAPPSPALA